MDGSVLSVFTSSFISLRIKTKHCNQTRKPSSGFRGYQTKDHHRGRSGVLYEERERRRGSVQRKVREDEGTREDGVPETDTSKKMYFTEREGGSTPITEISQCGIQPVTEPSLRKRLGEEPSEGGNV